MLQVSSRSSNSMRTSVVLFFVFLLLAGIGWIFIAYPGFITDAGIIRSSVKEKQITIRNTLPVSVEVADTEDARVQGLSGRSGLPDEHGLLMIFPFDQQVSIWMKDMHFSIDVIWADANGNITTIIEGMTPESYPQIYSSKGDARYVLEVPAGFVQIHNIAVGDTMQI
jgi:uncharacterized membrane protein (UPF0127 family)